MHRKIISKFQINTLILNISKLQGHCRFLPPTWCLSICHNVYVFVSYQNEEIFFKSYFYIVLDSSNYKFHINC